ncbi:MAG TPA: asparaginase [Anaerolineaceae bacterium]|nr:asparaginase [Anaerolineaceae bacterium]
MTDALKHREKAPDFDFQSYKPLVFATRGDLVESIHLGAIAVVDKHGKLFASFGDPELVTYLRSSSKPLQALPLIELGGEEHFHLTKQEISLMCASHRGLDIHVEVLEKLQHKIGVSESDLLCGTHPLSDKPTAEAMLARGEQLNQNRHNCSGKHTGFLAQALLRNKTIENYIDLSHPVQDLVLETFSEMVHVPKEEIFIGIDGCSVPVFGVPLRNAGWGFASLCDPDELSPARAEACQKIVNAMISAPEMVSGPGQFDTELMKIGKGKIIAKAGAEGYQSIGLLPGALVENSPALGIVYKIADGDSLNRARPLVGIEILSQLGVLDGQQLESLSDFYIRPIKNWRGLEVGKLKPVFQLQFH